MKMSLQPVNPLFNNHSHPAVVVVTPADEVSADSDSLSYWRCPYDDNHPSYLCSVSSKATGLFSCPLCKITSSAELSYEVIKRSCEEWTRGELEQMKVECLTEGGYHKAHPTTYYSSDVHNLISVDSDLITEPEFDVIVNYIRELKEGHRQNSLNEFQRVEYNSVLSID